MKETASRPVTGTRPPLPADRGSRSSSVVAVWAGVALFTAAVVFPWLTGVDAHAGVTGWEQNGGWAGWAPLAAAWAPRIGPGTLPAVGLAVAVVLVGPKLAATVSWRLLVLLTWSCGWAWTLSLALVDGRSGLSEVFSRPGEYVYDATRVSSVTSMLSGFVARIPSDSLHYWHTHVAGHPPGALLVFIGLDRIGISDPFSVGVVILTAGSTATVAALVAVRALAGEHWARRAAPFLAAAPAAIWLGVSADALYTAVAAWGLASLALAATRPRHRAPYGLVAGLLLGYCVYLSYGLVLLCILAVAVLVAARRLSPLPWALAGAFAVAAAFSAAGFLWWDAYPVLVARYYDGIGTSRHYWYWVWADLAAATAAGGLAVWAGLPVARRVLLSRAVEPMEATPLSDTAGARSVALMGSAAVACMLVSTLSGMSKAEVERIWLPFVLWALLLPTLLDDRQRRWLLALQVTTALVIASLLQTAW